MMKRGPNLKLRAWRNQRGLTMEEAAAQVVVGGEPCTKPTWYRWESAGAIPKPEWMIPLCELTGLQPNDFYRRPDGGAIKRAGDGNGGNGSPPPPPKGKSGNGTPPQLALQI